MDQPLLVLLLPSRLERFDLRERARELLRAPGVVAVDPSRMPLARMPSGLAAKLAIGQAKRMRLPGRAAAVAIFHPVQLYLAGALIVRYEPSELWYAQPEIPPRAGTDLEYLDATAAARAALTVRAGELFELAPLRMAELRIAGAPLSGPPSEGVA